MEKEAIAQRRPVPPQSRSYQSNTQPSHELDGQETGVTSANGQEYRNQRSPTPPPYSGPVTTIVPTNSSLSELPTSQTGSTSSRGGNVPRYPGLPRLDYRLYCPPLFKLSSDRTTLTTRTEYLSSNANALIDLIRAQSTVPPKPVIQVRGTRGRKVDFDVRLNLMTLLVPEDERQRMDYIRCVAEGEQAFRGGLKQDTKPHTPETGLEEWCRQYINSTAPVKSFALERVVANLDILWIEGQLRSLIASSLSYKGAVDVVFTTTHAKVVIQNPDKVNGFFTSVTTLFSGKNKFEVVKAVWPFATTKGGQPGRKCIVQTEETWWKEWRTPIRHAIASKRHGWVTVEDKLEALMEPTAGSEEEAVDWGYEG